MDQYSHW